MAVRYCDRTMRRSSSNQRGSLLPDKSIAPPVCQKLFQFFWASARDCSKLVSRCVRLWRKRADQLQFVGFVAGHDFKLMLRRVRDACARRPRRIHNVAVVVQLPRKMAGVDFVLRENCFMRVRMVPIRRHRFARAVGKMDLNRQPPRLHQRRFHMHGNRIQFRIADRFHFHRLAVEFEMAR